MQTNRTRDNPGTAPPITFSVPGPEKVSLLI